MERSQWAGRDEQAGAGAAEPQQSSSGCAQQHSLILPLCHCSHRRPAANTVSAHGSGAMVRIRNGEHKRNSRGLHVLVCSALLCVCAHIRVCLCPLCLTVHRAGKRQHWKIPSCPYGKAA